MAIITRDGFGQVEDNHLSAKRSGHVYGQLPAAEDIEILENGMFVKYNYADGIVDFNDDPAEGPWFMVYNEEKLYDERYQMHKHYAMTPDQFYDGKMVPRVIAIELGDLYTTNMFKMDDPSEGIEITEGMFFAPEDGTGQLVEVGGVDEADLVLKAVKIYTMPDAQPGVKLQCVKA